MHDVSVTMKDGRTYCGPLWLWRPQEGYFTLVLDSRHYDHEPPERIYLDDVSEAVEVDVRYNASGETKDIDLLERARRDGWEPTENT